tara:strand:- start:6075 stop:6722 length:648 start_codon:yes stop_codon:yes gene_type:complete
MMSISLPTKWKPEKSLVVDMLVSKPEARIQDIADKAGVTKATIHNWLKDPEFVEIFYQKYMVSFGAKLPSILNSMIREAEAGNVQAGRLILEHSGKLIKRVEVNNHKSPFEKFLNTQASDMQEIEPVDAEFEEIEVLPRKPVVPPKKETKVQLKSKKLAQDKKNTKRREARRWRLRAEAVGIEKPKRGRQTPAQRKMWQDKVINREKALNIKPLL